MLSKVIYTRASIRTETFAVSRLRTVKKRSTEFDGARSAACARIAVTIDEGSIKRERDREGIRQRAANKQTVGLALCDVVSANSPHQFE